MYFKRNNYNYSNNYKFFQKKAKVWFKKQKYHCIYEYPKEPESPILQSQDLWKPQTDFKLYTGKKSFNILEKCKFNTTCLSPCMYENILKNGGPGAINMAWNVYNILKKHNL